MLCEVFCVSCDEGVDRIGGFLGISEFPMRTREEGFKLLPIGRVGSVSPGLKVVE